MIFNSLGSNYSTRFLYKSLFAEFKSEDQLKLKTYLENRYDGQATLLYKGREAIKLALQVLNLPKRSKVGITGFTCFVVCQAVMEAGYLPEFIDISRNNLNFNIDELKKHPDIKALIIQNTLGVTCDIIPIKEYCSKHGIFIIEDLAHSIGSKYENGTESGKMGDMTALSFSQDKSVDAVSGGALIIRNSNFVTSITKFELIKVPTVLQKKDKFYPLFTYLIRNTYYFGLGRLIHYLIKKLQLLSNPMGENGAIRFHELPAWYCGLILYQFTQLNTLLEHRNKIGEIYKSKLNQKLKGIIRFPKVTNKRDSFIEYLKLNNIYISDIWYDVPIAPKKYFDKSTYTKGSCPNSEYVSERIVNLPTHINLNTVEANKICDIILKWQNTQ
jgi:dTDP-4-amino-4,6-dideoxygalactose transaminase